MINSQCLRAIALVTLIGAYPALGSSSAGNGDSKESILLPIAFIPTQEIAGAFGTRWSGEVFLDNRNSTPLQLYRCPLVCPGFEGMGRLFAPLGGVRPERGYVLHVPAGLAPNITLSNRMFERTLRSQPRGVDLPVVRERDYFSTTQTFLGVPSDAGVRVALRVYNPWAQMIFSPQPEPRLQGVTVQFFGADKVLLASTIMIPTVDYKDFPDEAQGDEGRPGLAIVHDLAASFPGLTTKDSIHVVVTPFPANAQYWAMISVTDNATQSVSIITAQ